MNINEIQDLIKFVAKAGVIEVEIEKKDFKLVIKSDYMAKKKTNFKEETKIVQQISPVSTMPPPMVQQQVIAEVTKAEKKEETKEDSNLVTIKAQMIGTFYRSSAPEKPPFVEVGSIIKPGNTLCIIEAMKLFNEIESEVSGKIVKILVDDVSPIEFDQPLFLIDPNI
jgi:acetyl-CoA carboxylase biotin carboxyl carrier protein